MLPELPKRGKGPPLRAATDLIYWRLAKKSLADAQQTEEWPGKTFMTINIRYKESGVLLPLKAGERPTPESPCATVPLDILLKLSNLDSLA